jgi:hypothetical protein
LATGEFTEMPTALSERFLPERVRHAATPRAVAVALGLYLLSIAALQWSDLRLAAHAPGVTKPDLNFGYGHAEILSILTALGESGRTEYAWGLVIDSVMPILLAVATILVAARAAPRLLPWLSAAPVTFMVLDLIENASFGMMVAQYPEVSPALVAATSPVTMVKLVSFTVTFPTLVVGTGMLVVRWARGRRRAATGSSSI